MNVWSLLTVFILVGCNLNRPTDHSALLEGSITKAEVVAFLPGIHFGRSQRLEVIQSHQEPFKLESGLVTHGNFLFLAFAPEKAGQLENYTEITDQFVLNSAVTKVYDIGHAALAVTYERFVGRTILVYNDDRAAVNCSIKQLVLVSDQACESPYLAAALEVPEGIILNNDWATTNKKLRAYPFTEIVDPETELLAMTYFDSLTEYHRVKDAYAANTADFDYEGTEVHVFEFRKNEKYVWVQYNFVGTCGSLEANYSALYHVTPGVWVREAEGALPLYFQDLIDLDGDLYPELIFTGFSETAIYEINFKGFSEVNHVAWSSNFCPC